MERYLKHSLKAIERCAVGYEVLVLVLVVWKMYQMFSSQTSALCLILLFMASSVPNLLINACPDVVQEIWRRTNHWRVIYLAMKRKCCVQECGTWSRYHPLLGNVMWHNILILLFGIIIAKFTRDAKICLAAYFAVPVIIILSWWVIGEVCRQKAFVMGETVQAMYIGSLEPARDGPIYVYMSEARFTVAKPVAVPIRKIYIVG